MKERVGIWNAIESFRLVKESAGNMLKMAPEWHTDYTDGIKYTVYRL